MSFLRMLCLAALAAAAPAWAEERASTLKAESVRNVPAPQSLQVRFEGLPGPPKPMSAVLADELERAGYRIDPLAEAVLTVRWRGPFRESADGGRVEARGSGGSDSRTELGFAVRLGSPKALAGEATYTIGVSLDDGEGEMWKAKVIAVSGSHQKAQIMRRMIARLVAVIGRSAAGE